VDVRPHIDSAEKALHLQCAWVVQTIGEMSLRLLADLGLMVPRPVGGRRIGVTGLEGRQLAA
jgi:hypothetical protein